MPNPWDVGSARLLAHLGFQALATTSSGFAGTLGRLDGNVTRDEALAHGAAIAAATDLPVNGDLENGFGDAPEEVAVTITGRRRRRPGRRIGGGLHRPARRPDLRAGGRPSRAWRPRPRPPTTVPVPFVLTARAENYLHDRARPRRHHRAPAGVPGGRGRRALRPRPARRDADRDRSCAPSTDR